jgi:hypothetical protein
MSQQNITTLQANINSQLADNTSGLISAADVRDNLINMTDSLLFNNGSSQTLTSALTVSAGITGSLQGTATTASYVANAVSASYATQALSASWAPNTGGSSFPYTGSALITGSLGITGSLTQHAGNIAMGVADPFGTRNINLFFNGSDEYVTLGAGNNSSKPNRLQLYSNTGVSQLIAANEILLYAPTIVLSGSVLFEKAITSSLQGTASYATQALSASFASTVPQLFISASAAASGFGSGGDIDTIIGNLGTGSEAYNVSTLVFTNANVNQVNPTAAIVTVVSTSFALTASYVASPYTTYKVLLSFNSPGVFSVVQLENTIGNGSNVNPGDIEWSNPLGINGKLWATKTGAFTSDNIFIKSTPFGFGANTYFLTGTKSDQNIIAFEITKHDGTQNSTPYFNDIPIEIQVYP